MRMLRLSTRAATAQQRLRALFFVVVVAAPILAAPGAAHAQHKPVIAVAASVAAAAQSIAQRFEARTGIELRLSFGASGNLSRQIRRGAPFELFISADESYPRALIDAGLSEGEGATYASGQLALMITARSGVALPLAADSHRNREDFLEPVKIAQVLNDSRIQRLAMANPRHAPYGRAARESLQFLGLWPALASKAIMGESVAQSARFAATDAVQAALLPLGTILHSGLASEPYLIVPSTWHAPLRHQMLLLKGASAQARRLFTYLLSDEAQNIFIDHGFVVPD